MADHTGRNAGAPAAGKAGPTVATAQAPAHLQQAALERRATHQVAGVGGKVDRSVNLHCGSWARGWQGSWVR